MKTNDNCRPPTEALEALQWLAPNAPLLALGQTIFWDEPMKLALLRWLSQADPTRRMLFGVHDTDYFARLHTRQLPRDAQVVDGFALLPHNDGSTRELWSAAGEMAQLFGSETMPALAMFARYGGNVARVADSCSEGQGAFIDALTEAWGWRGLVARDPAPRPVCEVPLYAVAPALDALLEFGLDGSYLMLDDAHARARACDWAWAIRQRVQQYAHTHPNHSLADLFVALYPELLESLYGGRAARNGRLHAHDGVAALQYAHGGSAPLCAGGCFCEPRDATRLRGRLQRRRRRLADLHAGQVRRGRAAV
jgi:hypothetical protein